jgi:hypothetical protein
MVVHNDNRMSARDDRGPKHFSGMDHDLIQGPDRNQRMASDPAACVQENRHE